MFKYPDSKKKFFTEDIFGVQVEDSYRWMEDEMHPDLPTWIKEQNDLTQEFLNEGPEKETIKKRLTELAHYDQYNDLMIVGKHIIYQLNDGKKGQGVYYIQDGLDDKPQVLIDPNDLSDDGTVAVYFSGASKDNRYITYLIASAGSDWKELRIMDLETRQVLDDKLEWVKFTFTSWQDNGFYYSAFDAPNDGEVYSGINTGMKVFYHKLGDDQSLDKEIFSDPDHPKRYHSVLVTEDEKTLILSSRQGTYGGEIKIKAHGSEEFVTLFSGFDSSKQYFSSKDDYAYFLSDEGAENKKVLRVHTKTLEIDTLIDEAEHALMNATLVKDKLILHYLKDVKSNIRIYDLNGDFLNELHLHDIGTPFSFTSSDSYDEIFFGFTSYLEPTGFYTFKLDHLNISPFKTSQVKYNPADYITDQIFTTSKDGTRVPAFVIRKKDTLMNGQNPCKLYAYGGFNSPQLPNYNPAIIYFIERGGIHVVANIRGGSEYGQAWHKTGMLLDKQNVYDDFIGVAEHLIENKYTSPDHLSAEGRSNGGLLAGAIMNQRPDLFKVVFPIVGVMDMVRYHKFTIGWGWAVEYGNPDEEVHFHNVYKYSPLHNIEGKDYPATLVVTSDHDDRVVPAHSFKYIARLQELNTSKNPMLVRIAKNQGHGAGKSIQQIIDEESDKMTFLFKHIK